MNLGLYIILAMLISHDPRLHDPDPGPQEKSTENSCVYFEKECIYIQCVAHVISDNIIIITYYNCLMLLITADVGQCTHNL